MVCPEAFKTQKYCDMLRLICPEMATSPPGDIRSSRYERLRAGGGGHPGTLQAMTVRDSALSADFPSCAA